uniref:Slit homolog 3 protein-like n=1 Tax=Callorhinchus milii TaxID=7868 RepID=A0A4W3GP87_CALMI
QPTMAPPQLTDAPQSSTPQEWLSTLPGELCAQDTDLLGRVQLNCSDRGLMSVPQALSPNTEVLILSHNSLTSVSLSSLKDLPQLRNLDLSNNQIAHFQADYRLLLEKLDLSHNKLSVIPRLSSLARLEGLQLASNAISALSDQAFGGLGNLKDLNLQDNQIEDISGHSQNPVPQLDPGPCPARTTTGIATMAPTQLTDAPQSSTPQEWLSTLSPSTPKPGPVQQPDRPLPGRLPAPVGEVGSLPQQTERYPAIVQSGQA